MNSLLVKSNIISRVPRHLATLSHMTLQDIFHLKGGLYGYCATFLYSRACQSIDKPNLQTAVISLARPYSYGIVCDNQAIPLVLNYQSTAAIPQASLNLAPLVLAGTSTL
jgi:hypothetical protein